MGGRLTVGEVGAARRQEQRQAGTNSRFLGRRGRSGGMTRDNAASTVANWSLVRQASPGLPRNAPSVADLTAKTSRGAALRRRVYGQQRASAGSTRGRALRQRRSAGSAAVRARTAALPRSQRAAEGARLGQTVRIGTSQRRTNRSNLIRRAGQVDRRRPRGRRRAG